MKTKTKTAAKKASKKAAPKAKAVKEKKPKAAKEARGETRHSVIHEMLLSKKHTDDEIFEAVTKKFGSCHRPMISIARWTLNQDLKEPLEKLVRVDGKLMSKSSAPKKAGKTKAKVDPAKDKLKNLAGINHKAKAAKKRAPGKVSKVAKKKKPVEATVDGAEATV